MGISEKLLMDRALDHLAGIAEAGGGNVLRAIADARHRIDLAAKAREDVLDAKTRLAELEPLVLKRGALESITNLQEFVSNPQEVVPDRIIDDLHTVSGLAKNLGMDIAAAESDVPETIRRAWEVGACFLSAQLEQYTREADEDFDTKPLFAKTQRMIEIIPALPPRNVPDRSEEIQTMLKGNFLNATAKRATIGMTNLQQFAQKGLTYTNPTTLIGDFSTSIALAEAAGADLQLPKQVLPQYAKQSLRRAADILLKRLQVCSYGSHATTEQELTDHIAMVRQAIATSPTEMQPDISDIEAKIPSLFEAARQNYKEYTLDNPVV